MEPIDNADKKTFLQWVVGKGVRYTALEIFLLIFYVGCSTIGIVNYHKAIYSSMSLGDLVFLLLCLNAMYWVNFGKTYQNYNDDKIGRTR